MQSLVLMLIPPDAQMFLSMTKAALALPILAVTSRFVPPCWSTTLPRYTNDSTCLMGSPPTVTGALAVVFIFISSVFFLLILSPVPADVASMRVVLSCIWLCLCDRSARSSAKPRSSSCVQSVHCIPLFLPVVVVFMIQSMTRRKRNGESRHPCRTPVFTSKLSDSWPAFRLCPNAPHSCRCAGEGRQMLLLHFGMII